MQLPLHQAGLHQIATQSTRNTIKCMHIYLYDKAFSLVLAANIRPISPNLMPLATICQNLGLKIEIAHENV